MNFTFHCPELASILTGLGRAMARKATLPELKHVCITGGDGQPVRLHATDLDQHVTYTVPDSVSDQAPGTLILLQKELLRLVKSGKDDQVVIQPSEATDTARIIMDGDLGRREHFLPALNSEEWPDTPESIPVQEADGRLLKVYRSLLPFASSDPARHVITGIRVEPHAQGHTLAATDGRRLCTASGLALPDGLRGILPPSKFLEWSQLPAECRIGIHESEYRVESGPWSIQGKLIDGTFPNWRQVIPDPNDEDQTFTLAEEDIPVLQDAVKTLPTGNITGKESKDTGIHIVELDGSPVLTACDAQGNWVYRPLPNSAINHGEGTSVNRRYLSQAVKAGFHVWRFRDELHPLQSSKDGDIHVLMPLRRETVPPEVAERKAQSPQPNPETETQPKEGKVSNKT